MQIIKTPGINGLGHTKKTRNAGNAILNESGSRKTSELNLEEIHVDNDNLKEQMKLIYENSLEAFEKQDKVIFLGGDHSISYPIGKAFLENFGVDDCFLIVFDAHADCMEPLEEPSHEEWFRALIEYGWKPENVVLVGVRKIEPEEQEFLDENKIKYFQMSDIEGLDYFCDGIMERSNGRNLYVSFDIDVVDPAFAPGTHYLEAGGFSSRDILYFAKRIAKMKNLKAVDIVEINEDDKVTVKLGAQILNSFI